MACHQKTSFCLVFASSWLTSNMLPRTTSSIWCVKMRQSWPRSPACTTVQSKFFKLKICFWPPCHIWMFYLAFLLISFSTSRLLLQLTTDAHAAETSMAFGSSLKSCRHLLEVAKDQGVQVVGVTFTIPSSCSDLQQAYTHALSDARCVFDMGVSTAWLSLELRWIFNCGNFLLLSVIVSHCPFVFRWIWALTWTSWTSVVDLLAQSFNSDKCVKFLWSFFHY